MERRLNSYSFDYVFTYKGVRDHTSDSIEVFLDRGRVRTRDEENVD